MVRDGITLKQLITLLAGGAQVIVSTVRISFGSVNTTSLMPMFPDAVTLMSLLIATVTGGDTAAGMHGWKKVTDNNMKALNRD